MAGVKPRIGITGPRRRALLPRRLVAAALRLNGAHPVQLRPGQSEDFAGLNALVITGGHDIDPVLYAAEPEVQPRYDRERDTFESAAIDWALQHRLPLLGFCRGAQLLNVRLGGSLFQDLQSQRHRTSHRRTLLPLKTLLISDHSRLRTLLACRECQINSLHNQAIDRVGDGLVVSGRDLDNIVQAVEHPHHPFLLGVQWHPEFLLFSRRQRRLFTALVAATQLTVEDA